MNKLLVLAVLALVFTSCKTKNVVLVEPVLVLEELSKDDVERNQFLERTDSAEFKFEYLSARGKAELVADGKVYDVIINLRMQKDKVIWASITALGFEAIRALITPDSIKIINRLAGEYQQNDIKYVQNFTNEDVDFGTLQAILLGNKLDNFIGKTDAIGFTDGLTTLSGEMDSLEHIFYFNENLKTTRIYIHDKKATQSINATYSNFATFNNQLLPQNVNLLSKTIKSILQLDIKFNRITIDEPLDFPFTVPRRFN